MNNLLDKLKNNKAAVIGLSISALGSFLLYKVLKGQQCCQAATECPFQNKKSSLYDRIGGEEKMKKVIKEFYEKVLKDDRVQRFFQNTDMNRQRQQQCDFLTMAFGGPNNYKGKNMADAHAGMNLQQEHFSAIVELLAQTFKENGVSDDQIQEIANIAESVREDTLGK